MWIILGDHFQMVPYSSLSGSTACPGGCRTNFAHFHGEGGLAPEVDSGYTLMRQSTVSVDEFHTISL